VANDQDMHATHAAVAPDTLDEEDIGDVGGSGRMSFLEHLDELRRRILYALAATLAGFLASLIASDRIFAFVMRPLHESLPAGGQLIYTDGPEVFVVYLQIGLLAGVLLASPVIMLQVWLFIAPGLYVHEKRLAIPFVLSATLCFIGGAAFSHYVSFPAASRFFASFATGYVVFQPKVSSAMSLYLRMLFACALAFQLPTVTIFLARMRLVTARWMARNLKYATLLVFIVAAVVTPDSSPVSQVTLALPMLALYVLSIGIAWLCRPRDAAG
jgi:sec-independent protein translocase protein TatC